MTDTNLTVADGLVVSLDYTLRLDDGQIIDSTTNQEALEYLHGAGQIISGLEEALHGMAVGDEKEVKIAPADGYGERNPNAMETVPRDIFPPDMQLTPGMGLQLRDKSGNVITAFVADIRPDSVVLDLNHPLAGETLHFQVKVAALRPATSEELEHGHAHDEGHAH